MCRNEWVWKIRSGQMASVRKVVIDFVLAKLQCLYLQVIGTVMWSSGRSHRWSIRFCSCSFAHGAIATHAICLTYLFIRITSACATAIFTMDAKIYSHSTTVRFNPVHWRAPSRSRGVSTLLTIFCVFRVVEARLSGVPAFYVRWTIRSFQTVLSGLGRTFSPPPENKSRKSFILLFTIFNCDQLHSKIKAK